MRPLSGSMSLSFFSRTIPPRAASRAVSDDDCASRAIEESRCSRSNNPNREYVRRILATLSSTVACDTRPVSMAALSFSGVNHTAFGISRSRPALAAPTVEYTDVQSLISMPSNPHSPLSISLLSHAFSVACTPLSGL